MSSLKEFAVNIGASAKSGFDKTKAVLEGQAEKLSAGSPAEKEAAVRRKEERVQEAEISKREAMDHNAAVARPAKTEDHGQAAVPMPVGGVVDPAQSRPIGKETGTDRPSAAHNQQTGEEHPGDYT